MGFKLTGTMQVIQVAKSLADLEGFKLAASKSGIDLTAAAKSKGLSLEASNDKVLFFRAKMLGYDLPNGNGDAIPRIYAANFGPSFIGKHLDVNHETDPQNIIGKVLATFHVEVPLNASENEERIIGKNMIADLADNSTTHELQLEGICMIDRTTALGDDIAKKLISGVLNSVSQEANTEYAECSVCAHRINNPLERICAHMESSSLMMQSYQVEGKSHKILAYKVHHNPVGTGLGVVTVPAYDKAKVSDITAEQAPTAETSVVTIPDTAEQLLSIPMHPDVATVKSAKELVLSASKNEEGKTEEITATTTNSILAEFLLLSQTYADVRAALTKVLYATSDTNLSVSAGIVSGDTATVMGLAKSASSVGVGYKNLVAQFWGLAGRRDGTIASVLAAKAEGKKEKETLTSLSAEARMIAPDCLIPIKSVLQANENIPFFGALDRVLRLRSFLVNSGKADFDKTYADLIAHLKECASRQDMASCKEALNHLERLEASLAGVDIAVNETSESLEAISLRTGFVVSSEMFSNNESEDLAKSLLAYLLPENEPTVEAGAEEPVEISATEEPLTLFIPSALGGYTLTINAEEPVRKKSAKRLPSTVSDYLGDIGQKGGFSRSPSKRSAARRNLRKARQALGAELGELFNQITVTAGPRDNKSRDQLALELGVWKKAKQNAPKDPETQGLVDSELEDLQKRIDALDKPTKTAAHPKKTSARGVKGGVETVKAKALSPQDIRYLSSFVLDHVKHFGSMPEEWESEDGRVYTFNQYIDKLPHKILDKVNNMTKASLKAKAPYTAPPVPKPKPYREGDKFFQRERLYWSPKSGASKTSPKQEVKDLTKPGEKKTKFSVPKTISSSLKVEAMDWMAILDFVIPFMSVATLFHLFATRKAANWRDKVDAATNHIPNAPARKKVREALYELRHASAAELQAMITKLRWAADQPEDRKAIRRIHALPPEDDEKLKGMRLNVLLSSQSDEERFDNLYHLRSFIENENPDLLAYDEYIDELVLESTQAFKNDKILAFYEARGYEKLDPAKRNKVLDSLVAALKSEKE